MPDTLLRTKLYLPPLRPNLVPRPRLIDQLNQCLQYGHKLVLISAPAGFGKTTLISAWNQQQYQPTASLSLDDGDNDLTRFLIYLTAALQTIESTIGHGIMPVLLSPEAVNVEVILTTLLNEVNELPNDAILILDDYHVIESQPVDKAVAFLLDHLPPQLHMVIASRMDPTLPLSRLRARGQMSELRAHDLRFTAGEAAAFLNHGMGLSLAANDIVALERHTEGWIAGLQLAGLSMQGLNGTSEVRNFISSFTGSHRYIQDYLADEVLQQRPKGTTDFLLHTSILSRLSAPLCDAVRFGDSSAPRDSAETAITGHLDSQEILESLEVANLFIVALDEGRHWYRYHQLFADLLLHRLRQTYPDMIPELHRRASTWYEGEGFLDEAVHHAQAASDKERMGEILERHWQKIIHQGETNKMTRWLDFMGPEFTKKSAPLSMAYCWIHVFRGANDQLPSYLADVKKALNASQEAGDYRQPMRLAVIPSLVETMEAAISLDRKQASKAKEHSQRAISLIPDASDPAVRRLLQGAAGYRLALAHSALGEYEQACTVLMESLKMLKASENYYGAAATLLQIVTLYRTLDRAPEAIRLCEETLDFIAEHNWQDMAPSGVVNVILSSLQMDIGDYPAAAKNLDLGRGQAEQLNSQHIRNLIADTEKQLDGKNHQSHPLAEPLTPRELEVLDMIASGHSNREIGEKLFLALDTVKGHNRNIYSKLGVKNRTQAVNKAISLQIISLK